MAGPSPATMVHQERLTAPEALRPHAQIHLLSSVDKCKVRCPGPPGCRSYPRSPGL